MERFNFYSLQISWQRRLYLTVKTVYKSNLFPLAISNNEKYNIARKKWRNGCTDLATHYRGINQKILFIDIQLIYCYSYTFKDPAGIWDMLMNYTCLSKSLILRPFMLKTYCISRDIPLTKILKRKGYAFEMNKKFTTYLLRAK